MARAATPPMLSLASPTSRLRPNVTVESELLDIADQFHPLQKGERTCLLIDSHEDFHRHERAEMLLQPVVVLPDAGLG